MKQNIIIVDNFYDDPLESHTHLLEKTQIEKVDEVTGKIGQILNKNVQIFSYDYYYLKENDKSPVLCHLNSDWIAIVSLTLPIFSFGELGLKFFIDRNYNSEEFIEKNKKENKKENWKEYASIPAKYNRMILFKSSLWHSFESGFGDKPDNCLLFQNFIIKEK